MINQLNSNKYGCLLSILKFNSLKRILLQIRKMWTIIIVFIIIVVMMLMITIISNIYVYKEIKSYKTISPENSRKIGRAIVDNYPLVICIALPKRRARMDIFFDNLGILDNIKYIDPVLGCDYKDIGAMEDIGFVKPNMGHSPNKVACYQSHIRAMQTLVDSKDTHALVFEDDLADIHDVSTNKIVETLVDVAHNMPEDTDLINLGICFGCYSSKILHGKTIKNDQNAWCGHARVITRKGAEYMLRTSNIMGKDFMDMHIHNLGKKGLLSIYSTDPIFYQSIDIPTTSAGNKVIGRGNLFSGKIPLMPYLFRPAFTS